MVGQHPGVLMHHLGHDGRLAHAGIARDQERPLAAAGSPVVDLAKQPFAAAEIATFFVQKRGEVPGAQAVVPGPMPHLAAQGRLDGLEQALEPCLVLGRKVAPLKQLDVIEPVDHKRRLAGCGQHGNDGQLAREAGEVQLIQADAIDVVRVVRVTRAADRMRAEQGHDQLRAPQADLDLLHEVPPGNDVPAVAPDNVTVDRQILLEAVGQLRGVAPAIAEEDADFFHCCFGRISSAHGSRPRL